MLNDRDYMRYPEAPFRQRPPRRIAMPSFLLLIIGLNVAMFFLAPGQSVLGGKLALVSIGQEIDGEVHAIGPEAEARGRMVGVRAGEVYRLISSMFVHGALWHLLFNMWGLYLFGAGRRETRTADWRMSSSRAYLPK